MTRKKIVKRTYTKKQIKLMRKKKQKDNCSDCGKRLSRLCHTCWVERFCEEVEFGKNEKAFVLRKLKQDDNVFEKD